MGSWGRYDHKFRQASDEVLRILFKMDEELQIYLQIQYFILWKFNTFHNYKSPHIF